MIMSCNNLSCKFLPYTLSFFNIHSFRLVSSWRRQCRLSTEHRVVSFKSHLAEFGRNKNNRKNIRRLCQKLELYLKLSIKEPTWIWTTSPTAHLDNSTYSTFGQLHLQYIWTTPPTAHLDSFTYSPFRLLHLQPIWTASLTVHLYSTYSPFGHLYLQSLWTTPHTVHLDNFTYSPFGLLHLQPIWTTSLTVHLDYSNYSPFGHRYL
jgi:hypothetical protein